MSHSTILSSVDAADRIARHLRYRANDAANATATYHQHRHVPPPWRCLTTTTMRAATNCARSRRPLPPLLSCRRCAVHRHRLCLRCRRRHRRRRRCRRRRRRRCCLRGCVTVVPSVAVALPSRCPSPSLPSSLLPSPLRHRRAFCRRCIAVTLSIAVVAVVAVAFAVASPSCLLSPMRCHHAVHRCRRRRPSCCLAVAVWPALLPRCHRRCREASAVLPSPLPRCHHLRHANPPPPCCSLSSSPPPRYPRHPAAALPP